MSYNPTHDLEYILAERNKLQSENASLRADKSELLSVTRQMTIEIDSLRALAGKMAEALERMGATWHNEFCNGEGEHESECIASDEALATYSKAVGEGEES